MIAKRVPEVVLATLPRTVSSIISLWIHRSYGFILDLCNLQVWALMSTNVSPPITNSVLELDKELKPFVSCIDFKYRLQWRAEGWVRVEEHLKENDIWVIARPTILWKVPKRHKLKQSDNWEQQESNAVGGRSWMEPNRKPMWIQVSSAFSADYL